MDNEEIDETALNVLLAEGLDVPTAVAASKIDEPGEPSAAGILIALLVFVPLAIFALMVAFSL
jgi:hypothetical protein